MPNIHQDGWRSKSAIKLLALTWKLNTITYVQRIWYLVGPVENYDSVATKLEYLLALVQSNQETVRLKLVLYNVDSGLCSKSNY